MKRLELVKARKDVNRKVRALQSDIMDAELELERQYKPITGSLKGMLTPKKEIKEEPEEEREVVKKERKSYGRRSVPEDLSQYDISEEEFRSKHRSTPTEEIYESIAEEDDKSQLMEKTVEEEQSEIMEKTVKNASDKVLQEYLDQYTGLAKDYIANLLNDPRFQDHDRKYGVRWDPLLEKFHVGNGEIQFTDDGKIIIVGDKYKKKYQGTRGLFELLFKATPVNFGQQDERNYQEIVEQTSAHKRNYDPKQQIDGNAGRKYLGVIKPMFFQGRGMETLQLTNKRVEYIPWNNPNKLVDRLRVLIASQQAGHGGHDNEIIYLIDELRNAHYIE